MLKIKGENHRTVSDIAKIFGVSAKSINDWIRKGIIPQPDRINYGVKIVDIYTEDYLELASKMLEEYRKNQLRERRVESKRKKRERFKKIARQKEYMNEKTEKELLPKYQSFPKEEIHFRLKNIDQMSSFIHTLFADRIPHSSYCKDILTTSLKDKLTLEKKGFELEVVKLTNLSELSLEERNDIKKRSRAHWLATRDSVIDEFLSKYGSK